MVLTYDRPIVISAAGSRKAVQWLAQKLSWSELVEKLKTPVRGAETLDAYLRLTKGEQDEKKDVGGFVAGTLMHNRRKASNVQGRDIITLDMDNIEAGQTDNIILRVESLKCAYALYSTRKHEASRPRLRVLFPANRTLKPDEYEPAARKIAELIGIDLCDPTTFEASRLMYWPSCCADSQYVYSYSDNPFIDADGLLSMYENWRDVSQWARATGEAKIQQKLLSRQQDPTEKTGLVGAWCKVHSIYDVLDNVLPGVYAPCDGAPNRYSYVGGSTTGGALIYEEKFLYSHHATDPAGGTLCNSFDLVRLHKFGYLDDEAKAGTPAIKMPSFLAMSAFAANDDAVILHLAAERREHALLDFAEDVQAEPMTVDDDLHWFLELECSKVSGEINKTIDNMLIILEKDKALKGKLAFDEFSNRAIVLDSLPWDRYIASEEKRRNWSDGDEPGLQRYFEKMYKLYSPDKLKAAFAMCCNANTINDVKAYLDSLMWDGVPRLDTLFIDYLGAEDSPYVRAVTRKSFTAAVARALIPGCKYDTMPILSGAQGIGKSTCIRFMGRAWFSESLDTFEGKEACELIQGTWINEIGELSALSRSEVESVKHFLSRTQDIFRKPYGRSTDKYPRRCVFFGTTNRMDFLKDPTGGRRFWPIDVGHFPIVKSVFDQLEGEVDLLWAEAVMRFKSGEKLFLPPDLEKIARQEQEAHQENNAKEGVIREFLARELPLNWANRTLSERRMYWSNDFGRAENETTKARDRVCALEVYCECFGGDLKFCKRADVREINDIISNIEGWEKSKNGLQFGKEYGLQKGFKRIIKLVTSS